MRTLPRMIALMAAVLCPLTASAATLLDKATPEQTALYESAKKKILSEAAQKPLILTKTSESYFWEMSARMEPLLKAYHYSHDPVFLEAYVPLQEQVLTQRYIHPTKPEWNGWFEYDTKDDKSFEHLALIDHDTILYYVPVLMFVREVRADPALKAKYGAKAEAWLKDVEFSMRDWDKRGCWQDFPEGTGWYRGVTQYPDPATGELKNLEGDIKAGGAVPYNKVNSFFLALNLAYQMTNDPWYKTRMEKCAKYFHQHWRVDDKHVEWNYRDHAFAGDYVSGVLGQGKTLTGAFVHPKGGYYVIDVDTAVQAYDLGIEFTKADIDKLIQTNNEFMFVGDEKNPQFKKIDGTIDKSGKYNYIGRLWPSLAHFSQKTRDLWKAQIDHDGGKPYMSWESEIDYLTEIAQPVSYDKRNVK